MKKLILIAAILMFAAPAMSLTVPLPYSNNFDASNSLNNITKTKNSGEDGGAGCTVERVAESWRGSGNYSARLMPPNITRSVNGEYCALGPFEFSTPQSSLTVAMALNIGTTWSSSAADIGGSLINKFIDTFGGGGRSGLLGLNKRGSCSAHEFGLMTATSDYQYFNNQNPSCASIHFGNGTSLNDYAGKWLWISYTLNHSAGTVSLSIWDQAGRVQGVWFATSVGTRGSSTSYIDTIGGYYNQSHPGRDANSRMLIDDLQISASTTAIPPPSGFVGGVPPPPPPPPPDPPPTPGDLTLTKSLNFSWVQANTDLPNLTGWELAELASPGGAVLSKTPISYSSGYSPFATVLPFTATGSAGTTVKKYFALCSVGKNGKRSGYSNEISYDFVFPSPDVSTPTAFKVTSSN